MNRLKDTYTCIYEQGFIPIFPYDNNDSMMLLDACMEVGVKCVEYTLRRKDTNKMIPFIKEKFPDIHLLVGSTIPDDKMAQALKKNNPQLMTLTELDKLNVDGFVSMIGYGSDIIKKYAQRRIIIPCAMTITEAFQQMSAGAHFIKVTGPSLDMLKLCRASALFDFCPLFFTGGMTLQRIPEIVSAGAIAGGTGFDVLLSEFKKPTLSQVKTVIKNYIKTFNDARKTANPGLFSDKGIGLEFNFDKLRHYCPFNISE
jgi:2-keto-3-deoxy-6-phosphogluconate aldolase